MTTDDAHSHIAAQTATDALPAEGMDETQTEVSGSHVLQGEQLAAFIPEDLRVRYDFYSYRHAAEILATSCRAEFDELLAALRAFSMTLRDIITEGGNESEIPKKFSALLRQHGWEETRVTGDLLVRRLSKREAVRETRNGRQQRVTTQSENTHTVRNFIDGHLIDYVKNRVAFDLEWNSKDQTFDRDLTAFSGFAQTGIISVGVLLTRSEHLNPVFVELGRDPDGKAYKDKYGASTTWMGKLLPRLEAGRNGACPVLAVGIRPECITDLADIEAVKEYIKTMPKKADRPKKGRAAAPRPTSSTGEPDAQD